MSNFNMKATVAAKQLDKALDELKLTCQACMSHPDTKKLLPRISALHSTVFKANAELKMIILEQRK